MLHEKIMQNKLENAIIQENRLIIYRTNQIKEVDMDFNRILEKQKRYSQEKHKIDAVTLSSYEKDFELTFTHNSTAIEGNTLTLMETKVVLEDGISIGGKELCEIYEVVNHKRHISM